MSFFAWVVGSATAHEPNPSSLTSGSGTYSHTQTHMCVLIFLALVRRKGKQRWGDYVVVEDDDLLGSSCRLLCCRGLLARFRDDDT